MKFWKYTVLIALMWNGALLCGEAAASPLDPVQVVMPDGLATVLADKLPANLQIVPRSTLNADALVARGAAGGAVVWIGPPEGLPPEFWVRGFDLSTEPVNVSPARESPLAMPVNVQAKARAKSAFLYSANEFPKHNIDEEIRADFLPLLTARDRFGDVIGYPGVLVSHVASSLVKNRFNGCQAYFFFFEDPLTALSTEGWAGLLEAIALRHQSGLQVEYIETNYASYQPGERAQIRARIRNFREAGASLNVRFSTLAPGEDSWRVVTTVRRVAGGISATEAVTDFPVSGPDGLHKVRVEVLQDVDVADKTALLGEPVPVETRETAVVVLSEGWSTPEVLTVDGPNFAVDGKPGFYAGTHYYPSNVWWEWAWRDFRPAQADRDFKGMRDAGNRIVRVWADPTLDEISLRAKDAAVWIAASHGVVLDVCVFNQWVRDLTYQAPDGSLVDFEFRHPKDFNLYSFSLRNMAHQRAYLQTLARRWARAGNVAYNLANETYVKNPDATQMDAEVQAWEEAALPEGTRRDGLLFQRWGLELEKAVRDAGGDQMVFPGYMFSLSQGGDAYLGNARAPFTTWHGYFSPEGIGETVQYFDPMSSSRPLLLEEFGNLGWNNPAHYDAAMHYAVAAGAGIAMSYEWGISWLARESSFVPLPMRDALAGHDSRWFQPIVDYARENAAEGGVGIAPWPSGWGYGSIFNGTPFPAEAAEAVRRMSWFSHHFARASRETSLYVVMPEASTDTLLAPAMDMFKQLWTAGLRFGVWQEAELGSLPASAKQLILPGPLTTLEGQTQLEKLKLGGLVLFSGTAIIEEVKAAVPTVAFAPATGVNYLSQPMASGTLHAFYRELDGADLQVTLGRHRYEFGLKSFAMVLESEGGPSLIEGACVVHVDGETLYETGGARVMVAAEDGKALGASRHWRIGVASPGELRFPRPVASATVLLDDGRREVVLPDVAGTTSLMVDRELSRYPVVVKF